MKKGSKAGMLPASCIAMVTLLSGPTTIADLAVWIRVGSERLNLKACRLIADRLKRAGHVRWVKKPRHGIGNAGEIKLTRTGRTQAVKILRTMRSTASELGAIR